MKKTQKGITLVGMLFAGVVLMFVVILSVKIAPDVIEYYKIKKCIAATAANGGGKGVAEIRLLYSKYAEVDHIRSVAPEDLGIGSDGGGMAISFGYEKRIPLFSNVSLLIDFYGSSFIKNQGE